MKVAFFSDIHANPERFCEGLLLARNIGAEQIVALGDYVGYGPRPNEALNVVRESTDLALIGNHDAAIIGAFGQEIYRSPSFLENSLMRAQEACSEKNYEWLLSLKPAAWFQEVVLSHGSLGDPIMGFVSPENVDEIHSHLYLQKTQISFVGHTHRPLYIGLKGRRVKWREPKEGILDLGKADKWILNPGSIGLKQYKKALDRRPSFAILDLEAKTASWHRLKAQ